jgi:hypothetical protein
MATSCILLAALCLNFHVSCLPSSHIRYTFNLPISSHPTSPHSISLPHNPPQLGIIVAPLDRAPLNPLLTLLPTQQCLFERAAIVVQLLRHTVPPHTLPVPADLTTVGFAVFLCVELGGADRGACIDEEEARHGEGGEGGHYGLLALERELQLGLKETHAAIDDATAACEARWGIGRPWRFRHAVCAFGLRESSAHIEVLQSRVYSFAFEKSSKSIATLYKRTIAGIV